MPHLILVDKPEGITSFGVVAALRKKLCEKRIGHTGTLDPMATGVLPVLTGTAARLSNYLLESDKRYTASVRLGITTDSGDITGNVIKNSAVSVTDSELKDGIMRFLGKQTQIPPMYSAIKKDGVPLYKLARKGVETERTPREIEIKKIDLINRISDTDFVIDVVCSKGTYIRSLSEDIGKYFGTGATLFSLKRTEVSGFKITDCIPLEKILESEDNSFLLDAELAVKHLDSIEVSARQATRFSNGGQLDINRVKINTALPDKSKIRVKCNNELLGLGEIDYENERINIACIIK